MVIFYSFFNATYKKEPQRMSLSVYISQLVSHPPLALKYPNHNTTIIVHNKQTIIQNATPL